MNNLAYKSGRETSAPPLPPMQTSFFAAGTVLFIVLAVISYIIAGAPMAVLTVFGLVLGFTLFHARFGFTSAFRRFVAVGNGEALRAHMVMLAVAITLFAPILYFGVGLFGAEPSGYVSPVGTSVIVGSFLFGIGMQLGNGCASGTLYSIGGGRSSMILVLISFIAGSVIGAWHFEFWTETMPNFEGISLATDTGLGFFGAWVLQMAIFGGVILLTFYVAKKRKSPVMSTLPTSTGLKRIVRGSWPLLAAAVILAVFNALTLMVRGEPWGITGAFALWGSKIAQFIGIDVLSWGYWSGGREVQLEQSVFQDTTSVMNFAVMIGAFMAATAGGVFSFKKKIPFKIALASIIGGLLMGYGARLAFGCNIGAYFGGIASFSVHGWLWMVFGMLGTFAALFIRPFFGLQNPKKDDKFC
ncbi:YeeE/YedE family protein [Salipaludibacillus sp. CUR1]|uniref:YeeE/YedE family protein n=1 Tax=Salipaludibacillus sp. CUR1 TaxID=2820003 RepID=UPI001E5249AC|nr:YeeE/YedE family protein [Salipaludibacillus sp. CUR1]MCE7792124.1 YeeE/YedE family protein [Salipaludibacillus sp. CUR1]